MIDNIHDISKTIDQYLNVDIKSLIDKQSKSGLLYAVLSTNQALHAFAGGQISAGQLREAAEHLSATVDLISDIVHTLHGSNKKELLKLNDNEIAPIDGLTHSNLAYKFIESFKHGISDKLVAESVRLSALCYNIYRNTSMLETNVGSNFKFSTIDNNDINTSIELFNRLLVESVSTGAIAIMPAALPIQKKKDKKQYSGLLKRKIVTK